MRKDILKHLVKKSGAVLLLSGVLAGISSISIYAASWAHDGRGWWYDLGNGTYPANSWYYVDGRWYCFDGAGYMRTGWIESAGNWYYCGNSGAMATGWYYIDGNWYYFEGSGAMVTNQRRNGGWIDEDGVWTKDEETEELEDEEQEIIEELEETVQQENSTLSISGHQALSGDYSMGTTVLPTGVIESNYDIQRISVRLRVHYMGTTDYTKNYQVSGKRIDLEDLDLSYFDTKQFTMSGAGYQFIVSARDASGTERELVNDYFNLKYTERLECSLEDYEEIGKTVSEGTDYEVNGVIHSNYPINSVNISLKSQHDGSTLAHQHVEPYTLEYNLGELKDEFDFGALEAGKYRYTVTVRTGGAIKTLIQELFDVEASSGSGGAVMYSVNASFEEKADGTVLHTNGSRPFSGRILLNAKSRIERIYRSSHPYVEFGWQKENDIRDNHMYAHSDGEVILADHDSGEVEIYHEGSGYTVRYTGLEDVRVYKGWFVDENTTVGEIPEDGRVAVYLTDGSGQSLDIVGYLDSDF